MDIFNVIGALLKIKLTRLKNVIYSKLNRLDIVVEGVTDKIQYDRFDD